MAPAYDGRAEEDHMASYYVEQGANFQDDHPVHDRSRCPPSCFAPERHPAYLGEFLDAGQAVCVARVMYVHAHGCACCGEAIVQQWVALPLSAHQIVLRP
ncbi:MAG: hypothetical protein EOO24_11990 [Comamonadaceae bacterium]|nr:MAG: hypothetical protein EOO24_11990 [Comamonadaceae bacterium]